MKLLQSIKAFFYIYFKSLTSVKYYRDVVQTNKTLTLKYFIGVIFLASMIFTGVLAVKQVPAIHKTFGELSSQGKSLWPEDLVLSVKGGSIKVNKPEPYIIPMPETLLNKKAEQPNVAKTIPSNLVVFDTNGTINDFEKYDTLAIVNNANILVQDQDKISANPTKDLPDSELNKAGFIAQVDSMSKYVNVFLVVLIGVECVAVFVGLMLFRFVYVLIVGLIFAGLGKVIRHGRTTGLEYEKYLKIAIHTYTIPLTLWLLVGVTGVNIPIPFWGFIINLVFGIIVIKSLNGSGSGSEGIEAKKQL